jgi:diadenosine tetraphosphatase ApaH/serine/threonine PP2A family protein phosphatase
MKAIISDVHGNLEALEAVVDDMNDFDVEDLYCLGDTVGYGPNPGECLDILMNCKVHLLGNHEEAMREKPTDFTAEAARVAEWTLHQLRDHCEDPAEWQDRLRFLRKLPRTHKEGENLYVHGSPRDPTREYVYPHDLKQDSGKIWDIFRQVGRCCFMGHTHIPGIFTESFKFHPPEEIDYHYALVPGKLLCNVGSVGQPRDGDWRACYVLFDDKTIHFRRVEYDMETTVGKMKQVPELKNFLKWHQR